MVDDRSGAGAARRDAALRRDAVLRRDAAAPPAAVNSGRHRAAPAPRSARQVPAARLVLAGPVVGLAAVLVVAGWPDRPPTAASAPAPAAVSAAPPNRVGSPPEVGAGWLRVLDGLDAVRSRAYERGDPALLGLAWAPGERLRADTDRLRALLGTGCTARGVRHRFDDLAVVAAGGRRVRLRVTQWLQTSERIRAGRVIGRIAGTPPTTVTLDLLATDRGWRLG